MGGEYNTNFVETEKTRWKVCYWHLVSRGQECCSTRRLVLQYLGRTPHPPKNFPAPNVNTVKIEKVYLKLITLHQSGSLRRTTLKCLDQHYPIEISVVMELSLVFPICAVQWESLAMCGYWVFGVQLVWLRSWVLILYFILIHLKLNSHMCLLASVLDSTLEAL